MSEPPDIPPGLTSADMPDLERYTRDDEDTCDHPRVVRDDDGLTRHWWWCLACDQEVRPGEEPDTWETTE